MPRLAGLIEGVDSGLAHVKDEAGLALGDTMLLHPIVHPIVYRIVHPIVHPIGRQGG